MTTMMRTALAAILAACALTACASDGKAGDVCNKAGSTDGCESGTICSNDSGGNYCRKTCTDQAQCSATESCGGISGSTTKACQPKK